MRLVDLMETEVDRIRPDRSADEAWNQMQLRRIHHLVVMDGSELVGVISDRDLGGRRGQALRRDRTVRDLMTPHVVSAAPTTTVREAANLMRGRTIGCLPVFDKVRLVGIVTTTDLLELIGRGSERPVAESRRWTMKGRGPRRRKAYGIP
jgi:acetoin utilization protein AcuB